MDPLSEMEKGSPRLNKGDVSNGVSLAIFVLGVILRASLGRSNPWASSILALGLFGFAGGVTNWLAVKMLFDKIPLLIGSGVIPRRFKDILEALKSMMLDTFFEEKFLKAYLNERSGDLLASFDAETRLKAAMSRPGFDQDLAKKLQALAATNDGQLLTTLAPMFGGFDSMVPMIKPLLTGLGVELVNTLTSGDFDVNDIVDVANVRKEIDRVLSQRVAVLTPLKVKRMMTKVIRDHLGWLVVWGSVFGGLIGIASWLADY